VRPGWRDYKSRVLGLPENITACLFDMDGVLTDTASVHSAAWKQTFDELLRRGAERAGQPFAPFTAEDYLRYVDGRRRPDGVRTFLASRGIVLPEGEPDDPSAAETVNGVGNRKNELLLERIRQDGVNVFEGSRRYVEACRRAGLATAVVSASANTPEVLKATGMDHLFSVVVDGNVARRDHLPGKPAPDTFLAGARLLDVEPARAAVYEDALAGVEAGRAGRFGRVIGVDRADQAEGLRAAGADVVVRDLAELLDSDLPAPLPLGQPPAPRRSGGSERHR
jgi:beta-phosphoglucomutase family hydrolase